MADGCEIFVRKWSPEGRPQAVVHMCHGMAEHSARYGTLAAFLASEGFVVYASDQRAHGQTALRAQEKGQAGHKFGHFEGPGSPGGVQQIIKDHEVLCAQEMQENTGLPFVLFGHSMGSVIATNVAASKTVARSLSGLALSGAPSRLPGPHAAAFGPLLLLLRAIYGGSGVAPLVSKLTFEKFNSKYAPNATEDDWLNRDPIEVQKYVDDPLCGFKVSVDFVRSFLAAVKSAGSKDHLENLPSGLPAMLINGGDDQVTINDLGARSNQQVCDEFAAAHKRPPKVVVYPDARHELMLETCREEVSRDVLAFLNSCVEMAAPRSRL